MQVSIRASPSTGCARSSTAALSVAPGLADATVLEVRVGLRPVSTTGMPLLGAIPDRPGAFVATGHGASGLTFGPWGASAVVDLALGAETTVDLSPFAPPVPATR